MIEDELNRGSFGVVYEGVFAAQQVAVKGVHKLLLEAEGGENALHSFCEECKRLKNVEHPHVISEWNYYHSIIPPITILLYIIVTIQHGLASYSFLLM